jgi:hypothetical protein
MIHVRFGSSADTAACPRMSVHVRFTLESEHSFSAQTLESDKVAQGFHRCVGVLRFFCG